MPTPIYPLDFRRNLSLALYLLILIIIAALATATYFSQQREIQLQKESALIINMSGRQRMLSQYIVLEAQQLINFPNDQQRQRLLQAIELMKTSHQHLTSQYLLSDTLQSLYFQPGNLDKKLKEYLALATTITQNHGSSSALNDLQSDRHSLLKLLDTIVSQYQLESESRLKQLQILQSLMIALIIILIVVEAIFIILPMFHRLKNYTRLATIDFLSRTYNRRQFMSLLRHEHQRCKRYQQHYSLLMIDIDDFKHINDNFGHPAGDKVIRGIADTLKKHIRVNDQLGRIGGEEFAIILVQTDRSNAEVIAEKLRQAIEENSIHYKASEIRFTASIGITTFEPDKTQYMSDSFTSNSMIQQADEALYQAKQNGKNCIANYTP